MTRHTPPEHNRKIHWPTPPSAVPLWELNCAPGETRVVARPGSSRPLEMVADPFSS